MVSDWVKGVGYRAKALLIIIYMNCFESFVKGITPGNYFLTKSMELTKINTSGTLWYLKKFLVLYDAIFLSDKIRSQVGIKKVIQNFDDYINSLPNSQREDAINYFYPNYANLKTNFRTWYDFAGKFDIEDNIDSYKALVNKYYFVYLMGLGGQSGVKAYIRDKMYNTDFVVRKLPSIIDEYRTYHFELKYSNSQIINDYPASLRNERQILFYFGFVHSRTNGRGNDNEFASLTPIGELAIKSNSKEFAIIWEQQKIKMISQPVTVEFPSISGCKFCSPDKFKLNYSPYLTILNCIKANNGMVAGFYDLILSRTNNDNVNYVISNYSELKNHLDEVKTVVSNFGIKSDLASEDFLKEIKKYLLGLRSDLSKDNGENYYGCIRNTSNGWEITDSSKLDKILNIYTEIEKYKIKRYNPIFDSSFKELKTKYKNTAMNIEYKQNHKIKMEWDLYNIKQDRIISLSMIVNDYLLNNNCLLEDINYNSFYEYVKSNFSNIMQSINLFKKHDIIDVFKEIVYRITSHTLADIEYENDNKIDTLYVNRYSTLSVDDLLKKLKEVSKENVMPTLQRKRDSRIIGLLNSLYLANYSDKDHYVKCECCGNKTFIKQNGDPYLEYHHLIPFSIADGPDHYENVFAICPMCHRKIHHIKDECKEALYDGFDKNNHFKKTIVQRLKDLYKKNILKSYQLEYALSEQMINEEEYNLILV